MHHVMRGAHRISVIEHDSESSVFALRALFCFLSFVSPLPQHEA